MFNYFDLDIIPAFLSRFNADKILVIGLSNEHIMTEVITFCVENESLLYSIDPKINIKELVEENLKLKNIDDYANKNIKYFKDYGLNILPSLKSFDAIFINDDPNWYTVFTELNLIKKNNPNFPLVFICNNKYPHKRRDSYINPKNIPKEYKKEYCNELPVEYKENNEIKNIMIKDCFYHALDKNTPNNGVLTAIEDFLKENTSLKLLEINPIEGISLIYSDSNIAYIRINQILENEIKSKYNPEDLSDKVIENDLLLKHIANTNMLKNDIDKIEEFKLEIDKKNKQIKNYEDELELHNIQIRYKDSQINNVKSQISLKETQLQGIEAKLFNKDNELKSTKSKLLNLENITSNNEKELENTKKQLSEMNNNSKNHELVEKKYKELLEIKNKEIENAKQQINEINDESKNQGIITNKYKELLEIKNKEIENYKDEINHLDNQLKNKQNEINHLDNQLKNKQNEINSIKNKLHNKGMELNKKEELLKISEAQIKELYIKLDTLKSNYTQQFSKLNSQEYCITCYKEKINNNDAEIKYLKKSTNKISKKLSTPLAYIQILRKSKVKDIQTNFKLYNALKNSNCFDIGYYLNRYPDVSKSKWCEYFSPELHFVCNGFDENRKINKKYFNNHNKKELIKDIKKMDND